jgi:predicted ABC-type ATPase
VSEIIIIAGPNGAGKTSFATEYLRGVKAQWPFVNADEIIGMMPKSGLTPAQLDLRAGRIMLLQLAGLVEKRSDFALETTLSALGYSQKIPRWQRLGYSVGLIYLRLASADQAIARVKRRVAAGGHNVPDDVVRRRFDKSREYLERVYKPIVDEWYIFDSLEGEFREAETWNDAKRQ